MNFNRNTAKILIKCLGPLLFVFLALKVVNAQAAWELLKELRWDLCMLSFVFFPWVVVLHAYRWWVIGRLMGMESSLKRLFHVYWTGWFLGFLPPGGVAVIAKIYYLKRDGEPPGRTSVSLGVDKLFDLISTALFGAYGLLYFQESLLPGYGKWLSLTGGLLVLIGFLLNGKRLWGKVRKGLIGYLAKLRGALGDVLRESEKAAESFWDRMNLLIFIKVTMLSLCLELSRAAVFFLLAKALGLNMTISFAFACRALIGLVQVVPVTVGGLGTREAVLLLTLPLAGFSKEAAFSLGFVSFLWNSLFHLSGVLFWLIEPLDGKRGWMSPVGPRDAAKV